MELNVLASVLPAKAWWNEAKETKVETGDEFMPAVTQLKQVKNTLSRLQRGVNDGRQRASLQDCQEHIDYVLDTLDSIMMEYT